MPNASGTVSLSSSFRSLGFLLLFPVLCAHRSPGLPTLPKPVLAQRRSRSAGSASPPRAQAFPSAAHALRSGRPISSRRTAFPAKGPPRPGPTPGPGRPDHKEAGGDRRSSASAPGSARRLDANTAPDGSPGRRARTRLVLPSPAPPAGPDGRTASRWGYRGTAKLPSLASARGCKKSQHAGPARSRLPPAAPGPAAVAGGRSPSHPPG